MKPIDERLQRTESDEEVTFLDPEGVPRTVVVKVKAWRDPVDGEIYLDADSIAHLDKVRARHMGVLAPQQLAKLRERLGVTQQKMGELLQIGAKTWSRWETGREVPSRSLNLLLLALYEGKIDVAYLRSKRANQPQWLPEPVLRANGWDQVSTFVQLRWLHSSLPLQCEIPAVVDAVPAASEIYHYVVRSDRSAAMSEARTNVRPGIGKTELQPLSA